MKPLVGTRFLFYENVVYVEPARCKSLFVNKYGFLLTSSFVDPCQGNASLLQFFMSFLTAKRVLIRGRFRGPRKRRFYRKNINIRKKHQKPWCFEGRRLKTTKNPCVFSNFKNEAIKKTL